MITFNELLKNLTEDFSGLKNIRLALLGDSSTQFLTKAIRAYGFIRELDLQILEADFDQIENQVYNTESELYKFKPTIVIIYKSSHKLLNQYNILDDEERLLLSQKQIELLESFYESLQKNLNSSVIFYNYAEIDDAVYGSYSGKTASSFLFQLRQLNYELMLLSQKKAGMYICDLSTLQNQLGKSVMYQPSIYASADMVLSLDILPRVAKHTVDIIAAMQGRVIKCIVLDLDNTLWGGIIGDDGIENIQLGDLGIGKVFCELQCWLKKLVKRGIILTVCSKNTESIAKEAFLKHPDMVLTLDDIAVFIANWESKAENINTIQQVLNIGFDSMVFIDDSAFERNLVRGSIPEITVPELPEDPAEYLEYLYSLNLFETVSISEEDSQRTKLYKAEAVRQSGKKSFANEQEYLKSLQMKSIVEPFTAFNIPRIAQLSQRSNQFNLRTVRYSEEELYQLSSTSGFHSFGFTLEDKYGNNGLVAVIVLTEKDSKSMFIDSWFMSCRVLKRGMENFVLTTIVSRAKEKGFTRLIGEYIKTDRNSIVRDHYKVLGFKQEGSFWILDLTAYKEKKSFISKAENTQP